MRGSNRRHHLPEQAVIIMTTAVVPHRHRIVLDVLDDLDEVSIGRGRVELVNIGLMMLGVMDHHSLFVHERLEHLVLVRQRRQAEIAHFYYTFFYYS